MELRATKGYTCKERKSADMERSEGFSVWTRRAWGQLSSQQGDREGTLETEAREHIHQVEKQRGQAEATA